MRTDIPAARKLFGEMAVQKGYCSRMDVRKALKIQKKLIDDKHPPKMLGLIMLEQAMIDNYQFIELLQELDKIVHQDKQE